MLQKYLIGLAILALMSGLGAATGKHGIYRSLDGGKSWVRSDAGFSGDTRVNVFAELGNTILAGTDAGIYVSVDQGLRWRLAKGGRVVSMAVMGKRMFAGTDRNGLLVSDDQGLTWKGQKGLAGRYVRSLLQQDGKMLAGMDSGGVLASVDGGEKWVAMSEGLPAGGQIFALAERKGRVFAALYAKGLYGWNEVERGWTKVDGVVPLELAVMGGTLIAGHNPGGLLWSDDGGARWSASRVEPMQAPVWKLAAGTRYALAGAADGVFYSADGGRGWTKASNGLPKGGPGIAFHIGEKVALAGLLIP